MKQVSQLRVRKLGEHIRAEIAQLIMLGKIKDPRVSPFLSVNWVDVSGGMVCARVYVSSFMGKYKTKQGVQGLESAAGFIRSVFAKKLRLRQCPRLSFVYDESVRDGFSLSRKIDRLESGGVQTEHA